MRRVSASFLMVLLLCAATVGCGQKGDLYIEPEQPPPAAGEDERDDEDGDG